MSFEKRESFIEIIESQVTTNFDKILILLSLNKLCDWPNFKFSNEKINTSGKLFFYFRVIYIRSMVTMTT